MLSPKAQLNLKHAKSYFREHLSVGDYYSVKAQVRGEWFGLAAARLGLSGAVGEAEFLALCEGRNPKTGDQMTQRLNSVRRETLGGELANRRVFYDFTISPPKSVSVVGLYQDDRILALHDRAVRTAMSELEKFAATRVRKAGAQANRETGNVIGAAFRHDTSRELDPHLHTHCVVLNATFDATENRWKAIQAAGMYAAQKFVENLYYHELAKGLRELGYEVENNARDFELKGVPASLVERFSKRHQQINEEAGKRIAAEGLQGNEKAVREQVARAARKRKTADATADRLRPLWARQMTPDEQAALAALRPTPVPTKSSGGASALVAWAEQHLFERRSVVADYELLSAALVRGRGVEVDLAELRHAVDAGDYLREPDSRKLTSASALACEREIVSAAQHGRRRFEAFNPDFQPIPQLIAEQATAVRQILGSRDFITLFRGGAGTGKSFTLKEVERGMAMVGRPVVVLAPQRQQVEDLRRDGLSAETVSRTLAVGALPRGAVVIVDEAGQLGGRELRDVIRLTREHAGRLILSGDTRQHGAVTASDALKAIEKHSGLRPIEIRKIRRQDPKAGKTRQDRAEIRAYRAAVKKASSGKTLDSLERLDALGWIRELSSDELRGAVAAEYLAARTRKENVLVVAQTREEVRAINESIRQGLAAAGSLGPGKTVTALEAVDWTEAQKRDARYYQPGQRVQFLRRYGRFRAGDTCEVAGANEHGLVLVKEGRRSEFSFRYADRVAVTRPVELELSQGDRLQLKFNGRSVEGSRLNNGELVTVVRIEPDARLVVEDDKGGRKTLSQEQRLFTRGYAVTSYASQGKTVDTVLLADAANRAATNQKQWYVSISRGRRRALIFTPDRAGLRANLQNPGDRELAMSLKLGDAAKRQRQAMAAAQRARSHQALAQQAASVAQGLRRGMRP
jgi:conjugative relaxase-like TrwC/TraI family protein